MVAPADSLEQRYLTSIAHLSPNSLLQTRSVLKDFRKILGPKPLAEADHIDVAVFAQKKHEAGIKSRSIKTYLRRLQGFFLYAYEEEVLSRREFTRIKRLISSFKVEKGERKTRFSPEQLKQLLEAAKFHQSFHFAVWMLITFGLRASELLALKLSDIDFEEKLLIVRHAKGKKTRRLEILDSQLKALNKWLETRERFFPLGVDPSTDSLLILERTLAAPSYQWLANSFSKMRKQLGFDCHAHRCRRTSACIMYYDHGLDLDLVSWLLGHASIQTTQVYLGISEEDRRRRFREKMEGKILVSF